MVSRMTSAIVMRLSLDGSIYRITCSMSTKRLMALRAVVMLRATCCSIIFRRTSTSKRVDLIVTFSSVFTRTCRTFVYLETCGITGPSAKLTYRPTSIVIAGAATKHTFLVMSGTDARHIRRMIDDWIRRTRHRLTSKVRDRYTSFHRTFHDISCALDGLVSVRTLQLTRILCNGR